MSAWVGYTWFSCACLSMAYLLRDQSKVVWTNRWYGLHIMEFKKQFSYHVLITQERQTFGAFGLAAEIFGRLVVGRSSIHFWFWPFLNRPVGGNVRTHCVGEKTTVLFLASMKTQPTSAKRSFGCRFARNNECTQVIWQKFSFNELHRYA